ncbi:mono/diheme cytochrome c family protein [Pedobacter sp. UYP30]|uniref:multiheme c-type cytochrome n=1 Tax=Pedobacter sp. UYP30 TaxID=1756400 RepID=UPI00339571D0
MNQIKRLLLIVITLSAIVVLCAQCLNTNRNDDAAEKSYVKETTCIKCHKSITDSYALNAHHNTSQLVTPSFLINRPDSKNKDFIFENHTRVSVETKNGIAYQVAYVDGKEVLAKRFDIAIGSSLKTYSFAYWENNKLFQLPLSYLRETNQWVNSPGFSANTGNFSRPIKSRCLQCHSSGVETVTVNPGSFKQDEQMKPNSLIFGINCQRCHGPASKHVEFQLQNPNSKEGKYITLYTSLTRKQKMEACGVCHSGNDVLVLKPTFKFKPGDKLSDYYLPNSSDASAQPDVHGNQLGLLMQSKCYLSSNNLTCNSCHNIHEPRKASLAIYSQRCMSCHKTPKHSAATLAKGLIKTNCIDCHMPKKPSQLISFQTAIGKKPIPYLMRTHRVAIYKD